MSWIHSPEALWVICVPSIAQLVERLTVEVHRNQHVTGSNPVRRKIFFIKSFFLQNASIGFQITKIEASDDDSDENSQISFRVANQDGSIPFSFDSSGNLAVSGPLDRETTPQYTVRIQPLLVIIYYTTSV